MAADKGCYRRLQKEFKQFCKVSMTTWSFSYILESYFRS
jgi:hypothetical protein